MLTNDLARFIKENTSLDLLVGSQRLSKDKDGLGYIEMPSTFFTKGEF